MALAAGRPAPRLGRNFRKELGIVYSFTLPARTPHSAPQFRELFKKQKCRRVYVTPLRDTHVSGAAERCFQAKRYVHIFRHPLAPVPRYTDARKKTRQI